MRPGIVSAGSSSERVPPWPGGSCRVSVSGHSALVADFGRLVGRCFRSRAVLPLAASCLVSNPVGALAGRLAGVGLDSTARSPSDSVHVVKVLPEVEVVGSSEKPLAPRSAASQGQVTPKTLAQRPLLRTGDVLETVPGLLISQHSGEGKANQYYLRGFNLDHGTDFATFVAGVPVNMPTHAHGQGYTDLNFLIPELISGVEYRKGTYSVEDGDFASAGSAHIAYRDTLPHPDVSLTGGEEGFMRLLAAGSPLLKIGDVFGAIEVSRNNGPWVHPDDYQKINGVVRYSGGDAGGSLSVTAMGYDGRWNATDQIPERAVTSGEMSRFGAIDPSDGGASSRYSLSADFKKTTSRSATTASAYFLAYRLNLFSNFTYFLTDSIHGDQIEQTDHRAVMGVHLEQVTSDRWHHGEIVQTIGVDLRNDDIGSLGLYHTESRNRLSAIRVDHVMESSASPFVESDVLWLPGLRTDLGVRADAYHFGVTSSYAPFSGDGLTALVSPKASLILGPWDGLGLYVNGGYGFHSEDARSARYTPNGHSLGVQGAPEHIPIPSGPQIVLSPLLARTKGAEVGARLARGSHWSASTALWGLDIASEHVFLGDQGLTAPSRPSRRTGVEVSGEARPITRVHVDVDAAYSRARFTDNDPVGNHVPGAVEGVVSAGVGYERAPSEFATVRLRYFGPRPLIEDNSVRSRPSTVLNSDFGYPVLRHWTITLQVFNVLDARVSDVDYYYVSRLQGEPTAGVAGIHFHPQEPRTFRLMVSTGLAL